MDLNLGWLTDPQEADARRNAAGISRRGGWPGRSFVWLNSAGSFPPCGIGLCPTLDATGLSRLRLDLRPARGPRSRIRSGAGFSHRILSDSHFHHLLVGTPRYSWRRWDAPQTPRSFGRNSYSNSYRLGDSTDVARSLSDYRKGAALCNAQRAGANDDGHAADPDRSKDHEQTPF